MYDIRYIYTVHCNLRIIMYIHIYTHTSTHKYTKS